MHSEDMLKDEESLFTSPGILDIDYLPRLMPFREEQQKYLASIIERLPSLGTNILIHGPPGIGKTACIRWIFRELRESESSETVPILINCWKDTDLQKMVLSLCGQLGINTSYRNPDELFSLVIHMLKSFGSVVLAFDEIDRTSDQTFLYQFVEELPHKCLFLISTKRDWLARLDTRVRSRLIPEMIEFRPYDMEQTRRILEERKKHAFVQNVWERDAFEIVAAKCYGNGDIRTGLALLKASGLAAEHAASRKIKTEHVKEAIKKLDLKPSGQDIAPAGRKLTDFS
ncbi:MAG: AAA family ATPase [Candidatus Aenigmarchaeota archaeon]|nr:AAA family ATPase [Candidatus Aenigmarchaeota archaeon]